MRSKGLTTNSELPALILNDAWFVNGAVDIHFLEGLLQARLVASCHVGEKRT
jgi:hypothetical protein